MRGELVRQPMNQKLFRPVLIALLSVVLFGCNPKPSKTSPEPPAPLIPGSQPAEPETPPQTQISFKSQGQRVPVIMYHDVIAVRDKNAQWYDCSVDEFEDQMKALSDRGAKPISVAELYKHFTEGTVLPDKAVVLTFDDNYQGFYDRAWPILQKYKFPAMMFVHTGFVGNTEGLHPKMTWDTLRTLLKDPLFSVGSHTISHPDDITQIPVDDQIKEIGESKKTLEKELKISVDFLAYPNGNNNSATQELAKTAGYKMAFSIVNGPAEESPTIFSVNRYVHTRTDKAWDDVDNANRGGALAAFETTLKIAPVAYKEGDFAGVKLALITGGTPQTVMSETREGVLDFIHRTPGAVAGINGGFFAMAAIASTDNQMVGPVKATEMPAVIPDLDESRWVKLRNRPIVMWGKSKFAIVAYNPALMNSDEAFKSYMPDITDTFLAGVWLVHEGAARSKDDMNVFSSKDIQDPRRRAFMGIMPDGQIVLGASKQSCGSAQFAEAIAAAGVREALLLDSGFSTSLVYGEKVMASGHSTAETPSRPVPHALLLKGELDPASKIAADSAVPATTTTGGDPSTKRKRKRRTHS